MIAFARIPLEQPLGDQAVVSGPGHGLAGLVHEEHPVRVPVEGDPYVTALVAARRRWRSTRFSGSMGFAGWFGNVPSSSK